MRKNMAYVAGQTNSADFPLVNSVMGYKGGPTGTGFLRDGFVAKYNTLTGDLELHGVTKSITFPADVQVAEDAVTVKAEFAINRKDFNINFPGKPNDLIRDNVVLKLDIKATPGEPRPEDQLAN